MSKKKGRVPLRERGAESKQERGERDEAGGCFKRAPNRERRGRSGGTRGRCLQDYHIKFDRTMQRVADARDFSAV